MVTYGAMVRQPLRPGRLPRVLVTAFEPFDRRPVNRSLQWIEEFVRESERTALAHVADLSVATLPVNFVGLPRALGRLWRSERPEVWILTGECGPGDALRVERVAINLLDAKTPDNAGRVRTDRAVVRGGPPAYFATLDERLAVRELEKGGARAKLSLTAGSYCCNQAFYLARHLARRSDARIVFLHVPRAGAGRGRPAPDLQGATRGLLRLVRAAVKIR